MGTVGVGGGGGGGRDVAVAAEESGAALGDVGGLFLDGLFVAGGEEGHFDEFAWINLGGDFGGWNGQSWSS